MNKRIALFVLIGLLVVVLVTLLIPVIQGARDGCMCEGSESLCKECCRLYSSSGDQSTNCQMACERISHPDPRC